MSEVFDLVNNDSNYKELLKQFRKHKKSGEFDFEDQGRIKVLENEGLIDKKVRNAPRGYVNQAYYKITEEGLFFLRNSCFLSSKEISYIVDSFRSFRDFEKSTGESLSIECKNFRKYLLKIEKMTQKLNQLNNSE